MAVSIMYSVPPLVVSFIQKLSRVASATISVVHVLSLYVATIK